MKLINADAEILTFVYCLLILEYIGWMLDFINSVKTGSENTIITGSETSHESTDYEVIEERTEYITEYHTETYTETYYETDTATYT